MRMPISRVRRATMKAITPYSPIAASSVASARSPPESVASSRSVTSEFSTCWSTVRRS